MAQAVECPKVGDCYLISAYSDKAESILRVERIVSPGPDWDVYISFISFLNGGLVSTRLRQVSVKNYGMFKKVGDNSFDKAVKMRDMYLNGLRAFAEVTSETS